MPIEKIIVLEDDLIVRKNLEQQLRQRRYDVAAVANLAAAYELLSKDTFDLMFVDVRLPDGDGTELLQQLQLRAQRPLVVIMTGFGSVESAVDCMRNGAFDYLIKPFSNDQIEVTLRKAEGFTQLVKVNQYLSHEEDDDAGYELLGKSVPMEQLRQLIRKVARTEATVLIQGESGTGKELVARALYRQSPRANAPFIRVNCAAIPENLIESEFFGHEKGAFTGAINKREGRFELAHNGTILLDEISEISPSVQAKLLRVLQERELERVGGTRTIKVDVRVIATTNRRLEQSVERKEFRQDLFFRLNVVPIQVPPLRDRHEDVVFLAEHFMRRYARKHGIKVQGISPACLRALSSHHWPGNVRELQNVIERAVILSSDDDFLGVEHLGFVATASNLPVPSAEPVGPGESPGAASPAEESLPSLSDIEKRHILRVLEQCRGNRTHAAKILDISIRTLRNKLNDYRKEPGSQIPFVDDDAAESAAND
ncbi:MAG TPA: sigma-54 dependent transcriptional regulator [Candidatus Paceibacterota bacterium]|nr:sigma-54 dependent transcriptional regulator [Verrucomicrobiota bacterium]HRY46840.1 sigma-54 dependent transcriptional regulator [Candidatus Paceibacterota bacterium]HSA00833.1 sigma-54 dependent transcriptional regulator [Candidatus Paceibacterota bacterium]